MAGARKAGLAHRYNLTLAGEIAGSAADTQDTFIYDAFAEGGATASGAATGYDQTAEAITEMSFMAFATLTGQATNFVSVQVQLIRAAAAVNDIRVVFSTSGVVATALTAYNLAVASGVAVAGGVLLVSAGVALPWTLQPGDAIIFSRLSNNVTGLATPSLGLNFLVQQKGA
jgi:hypothetical protein